MKNGLILFSLVLIIACSCSKEDIEKPEPLEPYMKSLLTPDTTNYYQGNYYIHVNFNAKTESGIEELSLIQNNEVWSCRYDSGLGMTAQGIEFHDPELKDKLQISFYYNTAVDTSFIVDYADYYFNDPWNNVAGANFNYSTPVQNTPDNSQYYFYLGQNLTGSYFKITYFSDERINGTFATSLKECCGGLIEYDVSGDFSLPTNKMD